MAREALICQTVKDSKLMVPHDRSGIVARGLVGVPAAELPFGCVPPFTRGVIECESILFLAES